LRVAAIGFLNPAPLMWDFEHPPLSEVLAKRYRIDRMTPAECAARLADGRADIGLIPIASLATSPGLQILPGCTIASKGRVRSLILVHRASRPLSALRSVAADTASRTTLAYARILFHMWGNAEVPFLPLAADLDAMLERADAAILIGDPALLALEERTNRWERSGEELVYHDMAEEWRARTGLAFVSAVWGIAPAVGSLLDESVADDFIRSRDHGLENIDSLVAEVSHFRAHDPNLSHSQHPLRARRGVRGGHARILPNGSQVRRSAAVYGGCGRVGGAVAAGQPAFSFSRGRGSMCPWDLSSWSRCAPKRELICKLREEKASFASHSTSAT
jgi:chorismate dehydratase